MSEKEAQTTEAADTKAEKENKPKREKIEQNGIVRPAPGTGTGRVWEIADKLSQEYQRPATRSEVLEVFVGEGGNQSTGATQYGKWRKFHGLIGDKSPKAPKAPDADADADAAKKANADTEVKEEEV